MLARTFRRATMHSGTPLMARSMAVHAVRDANELTDAIKSNKPVVVDFYATWCQPCRAFAPTFEKMSDQHPNVKFLKVDVDEVDLSDTTEIPPLQSVPTFAVFKNGQTMAVVIGSNEMQLTSAIKKVSE